MTTVSTKLYEKEHGKRPNGNGLWYFRLDDETVQIAGNYSAAVKCVKVCAIAKDAEKIELMP